jgi:hypothetical protein
LLGPARHMVPCPRCAARRRAGGFPFRLCTQALVMPVAPMSTATSAFIIATQRMIQPPRPPPRACKQKHASTQGGSLSAIRCGLDCTRPCGSADVPLLLFCSLTSGATAVLCIRQGARSCVPICLVARSPTSDMPEPIAHQTPSSTHTDAILLPAGHGARNVSLKT